MSRTRAERGRYEADQRTGPMRVWSMWMVGMLAAAPARAADAPAPEAPAPETPAAPVRVGARLLAQVVPEYPAEALADAVVGDVTVHVTVSPEGVVTDAVFASGGPDVLVPPALAAARALGFAPATRDGVPVVTRLAVSFHFEPPIEAPPLEDVAGSDELVVARARSVASHELHSVTTIGVEALDRAGGEDLGEALSDVPGVAVARGNSDVSKPIIRGQFERRLLVLFDGVRHESQKWGLDHATEIDPFAAGSIHVIKGAAGVRYGPDAIGGVVLVEPPPLRTEPGVGGRVQLVGVDNGLRAVGAARVDGVFAAVPELTWRVEGNYSRGAALRTPTYLLGNTGSEGWNLGATVGYTGAVTQLKVSYHHFDLQSGVCYCVQSGTPDDFLSQLDADAPLGADRWTQTYTIDRPSQAVTHDIALARVELALPGGADLKLTYAFQANLRQEYEPVRAAITGAQYDFTLRTHSLDATLDHAPVALGKLGELAGGVGLAGTFQENVYRGLPLIPNFRAFQFGVFGFERLAAGPVELEAGARYDHLSRAAYLTRSAFERSVARGTLAEADCAVSADAARCPAAYDAATASLGGIWHILPDRLEARLDLSSATRFPNADELYMNGSAPTSPVYALGDPSLGTETTWGATPTLGLRLPALEAEVSTYVNVIDDYVYFAPEIRADGTPVVDVTIEGAFPRFSFRPVDAVFYGVDGGFTVGPDAPVGLTVQGAIVRAVDTATNAPLVMTPADRVQAALRFAPPDVGPFADLFAEASGLYVFEQTRVADGAELAPPPDGYLLLGAAVGARIPLGARSLKVGIEANNLLNARYRDYTSLLRYYADEPGREVRLRLGLDF